MKKSIKILAHFSLLAVLALLGSCGDEIPTDYQQRYIIEAFLIEGKPISDLRIVRTIPINQPYEYSDALVRDAQVTVIDEDGNVFPLTIGESGEEGWYYPDSSYLVQRNTSYELQVTFADGRSASGSAFVPDTFSWSQRLPEQIHYPTDEEIGDAVIPFSWTRKPALAYMIRSWAMDTLDYGKYLDPPLEIPNMRIPSDFRNERGYDNVTSWGLIPSNQANVIWGVFRWYGLHEISIYNADYNTLRWFLQARGSQQYNDLLNTIEGDAVGCFGGATAIRDSAMILFPEG